MPRFRENTGLEHMETVKIGQFVAKSLAAAAYLSVLHLLARGGTVDVAVTTVLIVAAVIDLVPELVTIQLRRHLPSRARRMEDAQLVLRGVAYLLLAGVVTGMAPDTMLAYAAFTALWLAAFVCEEAVLFLLDDDLTQP